MPRAVILKASGEIRVENLNDLGDYQKAVGGLIEIVHIPETKTREAADLVLNEEGLLLGLERNHLAEKILTDHVGALCHILVGDGFVIGVDVDEGEFTDAPDWVIDWANKQAAGL